MKKIRFIFLIIVLTFTNVKAADECTTEEMNRLRKIANDVQFKTNYKIEE